MQNVPCESTNQRGIAFANSELCNYDSVPIKSRALNSNVTPFDLLKNQYMNMKNEALNKYSNVSSESDEDHFTKDKH